MHAVRADEVRFPLVDARLLFSPFEVSLHAIRAGRIGNSGPGVGAST